MQATCESKEALPLSAPGHGLVHHELGSLAARQRHLASPHRNEVPACRRSASSRPRKHLVQKTYKKNTRTLLQAQPRACTSGNICSKQNESDAPGRRIRSCHMLKKHKKILKTEYGRAEARSFLLTSHLLSLPSIALLPEQRLIYIFSECRHDAPCAPPAAAPRPPSGCRLIQPLPASCAG